MAVADVALELAMVRCAPLPLAVLLPVPLQIAELSLEMQLTAVAIDTAGGKAILGVSIQ
jgi:hypothetical protein